MLGALVAFAVGGAITAGWAAWLERLYVFYEWEIGDGCADDDDYNDGGGAAGGSSVTEKGG